MNILSEFCSRLPSLVARVSEMWNMRGLLPFSGVILIVRRVRSRSLHRVLYALIDIGKTLNDGVSVQAPARYVNLRGSHEVEVKI